MPDSRNKSMEVVFNLAQQLKANGDKILFGNGKLSLSTAILAILNNGFCDMVEAGVSRFEDSNSQHFKQLFQDLKYLSDFCARVTALKVLNYSLTLQGVVQITRFRNLHILELKRVPIHMVEGLQKLRSQLKTIIISRSLTSLQDLFETCGGDMSSPLSWSELRSAHLSYNSIVKLDASLRLLPCLDVIDLSHNLIEGMDTFTEYLTEVVRLNLGYNQLDSIPTFSITARSKLKTLILRNNSLDNIEGIENLHNLEELDMTDNCLSEHRCLWTLTSLHKLLLLSLQGNPLSYHKCHRELTIQHLSSRAAKPQFILDTRKLTKSEMLSSSRSKTTFSVRRSSQVAHRILAKSNHLLTSTGASSAYSFDESDSIATSLRASSLRKEKQHGAKKKLSKARKMKIAAMDFDSTTEISSREGSRDSSPVKPSTLGDHLRTKEEIEILRKHYGSNWLQLFTEKQNPPSRPYMSHHAKTEDDIYLNESGAGLSEHHGETQNDYLVISDTEPTVVSQYEEGQHEVEQNTSAVTVDSCHGLEWKRSDEEEQEAYGEESEMFIVTLNEKQILLTVNERYLIEKNLNGNVVEKLDLKSLEKLQQLDNTDNATENPAVPVMKLSFDYIKKDRRERIYAMEDDENAARFRELLDPFLIGKKIAAQLEGMMQCLKCSCQFTKNTAKALHPEKGRLMDKMYSSSASSDKDTARYACPKCASEMIVALDRNQATKALNLSETATPVGSYSSWSGVIQTASGTTPNKATEQKRDAVVFAPKHPGSSTPEMRRKITDNSIYPDRTRTNSTSSQSDGERLTTIAKTIYENEAIANSATKVVIHSPPRSEEKFVISNFSVPNYENKKFHKVNSLPDISRRVSLPNRPNFRDRISSGDSDITILNDASESSLGTVNSQTVQQSLTMSISSDDGGLCSNVSSNYTGAQNDEKNKNSLHSPCDSERERTLGQHSTIGEVTPMGSPLSNSVCSSMVSSVYQNALGDALENSSMPYTGNLDKRQSIETILDDTDGTDVSQNKQTDNVVDHYADDDIYSTSGNRTRSTFRKVSYEKSTFYDSAENEITSNPKSATFYVGSPESTRSSKEDTTSPDLSLSLSMDTSLDASHDDGKTVTWNYEDFTQIDHRLKLHIMMNLFDGEAESCECILMCDIAQYMLKEEFKGIMVVSSTKIYILKVIGTDQSEALDNWLSCIEIQPITELQYIDIGLGYQSFRFEFSTECSSFSFIVRDEDRCKRFISLFTGIFMHNNRSQARNVVFDMSVPSFGTTCNQSKLEGISKSNLETLDNLKKQVLDFDTEQIMTDPDDDDDDETADNELVKYLMCLWRNLDTDQGSVDPVYESMSLVISTHDICLVKENHQWPLPRLQASLDDATKRSQFVVEDQQKINNVATVEIFEIDHRHLKLTFFNEELSEECSWYVVMETDKGVQSLVAAIREPWENEFGIELEISTFS